MELPNSLCFCTLFPPWIWQFIWNACDERETQMVFSGERRNPIQIKVTSSGTHSLGQQAVYGYEITSDYLAERCPSLFGRLHCKFQPPRRESRKEKGKTHLQDPPAPHTPSWRGWCSSKANANTELTSGTAAKDDNLLPFLMIEFVICTLANWELEWDQWVILHRSLYPGPEWNCWPRGESL